MGAYQGVTMQAAGVSNPITINILASHNPYFTPGSAWALGVLATVSPGANLTYDVELTCDPVPSANGHWNVHDTMTAQTASANGNVAFPITGIRLNVTGYVSGSVNLGVCQWP